MKKRSIATAASTLGILAAAVSKVALGQVALPYYDPLNYSAGGLGGQGPWTRANTLSGNDNPIDTAVNLSYLQGGNNVLPPSTGSALLLNTMNSASQSPQDRINFTGASAGVYYSLNVRVDALNTANNGAGVFFANISDNTGTGQGNVGLALRIRQDPGDSTKFDLGIDKDGAKGSASSWSGALTIDGSTLLVVAKYQVNPGIGDDVASLWVNPLASTFGQAEANAPASTITGSTGTDRTLSSFNLGIRNLTDPKKYVDDIRVGTTWASVAPTVWKGNDSTYGATSNWYTAAVPNASGIVPSFLDLASASRTVALGANRTVGGMVFNSASGYTVNGGGSTLTLDTPDVAGALISGSAGNHTIAAPVVLNSTLAANISAGTITISGAVSGSSGVTMTGGAALVLTGANGYTGTTTINGGVIRAADGVGLPSTNLILTGGAFETTSGSFTRTLGTGANQVHLPSGTAGGFSAFGTPATVTLDGGNPLVWTSSASFSPSGLILNAATANTTLTLTNDIDINGSNRTFTGNATGGNATAATLSGAISNGAATTNGIIKNGVGLLVLTSTANSYNGQTQVLGGVLRGIDGVNIPIVPSSATSLLTLSNGVYEPTTATFTRPLGSTLFGRTRLIGGAAGFSAFGTPLAVDIGGDGTGTGGLVLWGIADFQPTTLVLNASTATASIEFKNVLDLGGAPATARVIANNSATNNATISGAISGATASTGLTKTGPGVLAFRSTGNAFVGTLTINQGTLNITDGNQLGSASSTAPLVLTGGGTLQFGNTLDLSNNRPIIIGAGGGVIDTNGSSTINGYGGPGIGGGQTAVLTKTGAGIFHTGAFNSVGAVGTIVVKGGTFSFVNEGQISGNGVNSAFTLDGGEMRSPTTWSATAFHPITVTANNGAIRIDATKTVSWNGTITGTGVLSKNDGGTFIAQTVRGPGINVTGGMLALTPDGSATGVSVVNSTAVTGGAQLDLSNNHLIDHTTGAGTWNGTNYTAITGLVATGRNSNLWTGPGIITSQTQAAGGNLTSIGVAKASDVRPATATATDLWAGQTITGTDTLVMYTYGGDANLDGKINIDDYVKIDSGIASNLTGWSNGDFNYDGKINIDDYTTVIDANIGNQNGVFFTSGGVADGLSGVSAVPEPAAGGLFMISAALLASRRSRRAARLKAHG